MFLFGYYVYSTFIDLYNWIVESTKNKQIQKWKVIHLNVLLLLQILKFFVLFTSAVRMYRFITCLCVHLQIKFVCTSTGCTLHTSLCTHDYVYTCGTYLCVQLLWTFLLPPRKFWWWLQLNRKIKLLELIKKILFPFNPKFYVSNILYHF